MKIDSVIYSPKCKSCGKPSAYIELVASQGYPQESKTWSKEQMEIYQQYRDFNSYYLMYSGPGGSNGIMGDAISSEKVTLIKDAFSKPYNENKIKELFYDMAGYCVSCHDFYCAQHWNVTSTGGGTCPEGHRKSLDPHWTPEPF